MASVLELACIYSALILHNKEVMVTEGNINGLVKAAGVNTGPSWPGLFAKPLASVNIRDLTRKAWASGLVGPPQQLVLHQREVLPLLPLLPWVRTRKQKPRKESEESDHDMGSGLFD